MICSKCKIEKMPWDFYYNSVGAKFRQPCKKCKNSLRKPRINEIMRVQRQGEENKVSRKSLGFGRNSPTKPS